MTMIDIAPACSDPTFCCTDRAGDTTCARPYGHHGGPHSPVMLDAELLRWCVVEQYKAFSGYKGIGAATSASRIAGHVIAALTRLPSGRSALVVSRERMELRTAIAAAALPHVESGIATICAAAKELWSADWAERADRTREVVRQHMRAALAAAREASAVKH